MFDFFKKKKITAEQQTSFEIELTAAVLAYEIARSDGEISKDSRPGKNTGKRIGVQIVLPDNKRIAFTSMANEVISKPRHTSSNSNNLSPSLLLM